MILAEFATERDAMLARLAVAAPKLSDDRILSLCEAAEYWAEWHGDDDPPLRIVPAAGEGAADHAA